MFEIGQKVALTIDSTFRKRSGRIRAAGDLIDLALKRTIGKNSLK